jgi:hypothetical protein
LTNAQKAVQSIHAGIEAARALDKQVEHPYTILLSIKSEHKLIKVMEEFKDNGFSIFPFREPDRNNELTAFAVGYVYGSQREAFKKYQLMV